MSVRSIDPKTLAAGTYRGAFEFKRWSYSVETKVSDGRMVSIGILNCPYSEDPDIQKLNAALVEETMMRQGIVFDAVAGATLNTRIYQKAMEDALTGAPE
jgi:uncharacterized protein with FMN-binding domain